MADYFAIRTQSQEEDNKPMCPKMTLRQRVTGWAICYGFGMFLNLLSWITMLTGSFSENLATFAILYSLGTFTAMLGSCFLSGFCAQIKKMFDQKRRITTIILLISIILTLVFALALENPGLTIAAMLIQWCASFWYSLSFIPGGHTAFKAMVKRCFGRS